MTVYHHGEGVTLHHGDSLSVLRDMPSKSVDCCVTSPPYYGLRDYGDEGQYGLEASPSEYVENMRALFAEVRRVLADDGTLWINLGDSYSSRTKGSGGTATLGAASGGHAVSVRSQRRQQMDPRKFNADVPEKNLLGIPWRVAFALQGDGWTLRQEVIWSKRNPMPESVKDRPTRSHEQVFLLTKAKRYWYDAYAIREEGVHEQYASRNARSVWPIGNQPFPGAHFATMPSELARRCVLAGCKPGGTVLDPFSGSGTTGMVAAQAGRKYVGIDLNRDYLALSLRTRLAPPNPKH